MLKVIFNHIVVAEYPDSCTYAIDADNNLLITSSDGRLLVKKHIKGSFHAVGHQLIDSGSDPE